MKMATKRKKAAKRAKSTGSKKGQGSKKRKAKAAKKASSAKAAEAANAKCAKVKTDSKKSSEGKRVSALDAAAKVLQNLLGHSGSLDLLVFGGSAPIFPLRFNGSDVIEITRRISGNLMGFLVALVGTGIIVSFFALVAPRKKETQ